jgi:hypothetical protein
MMSRTSLDSCRKNFLPFGNTKVTNTQIVTMLIIVYKTRIDVSNAFESFSYCTPVASIFVGA